MPSVGEIDGDEPGPWVRRELLPDRSVAVEAKLVIDGRIAGQHRAVGQAERKEAAGFAADPGVEILEIFRQHRRLDHAGETAVLVRAPAADAEERRALIGRPRRQRVADVGPDVAGDVRLEIIPVRKIDVGRRHHQAVDQRMAPGVENPGRFHLRQRIGELLQPQMQRLLARGDAGVGNASDDLGDFRQAAVDGLEHFQRVLVHDIERALDFPVGGLIDREPGNGGGKREQRQREGQRSDHHPLQQSQRIALGGLHGRSELRADLTSIFSGEQSAVIRKESARTGPTVNPVR